MHRLKKYFAQVRSKQLLYKSRALRSAKQIAGVAQLVEQLICNQPVASSSLVTSFIFLSPHDEDFVTQLKNRIIPTVELSDFL
jgi:hypothetical protein